MRDFRIITAKVFLKVISSSPLRGFLPPSIIVVGEKLNRTDEVRFNGVQAEEFVISSESRLVVRIPKSQVGKALFDLRVLASTSAARKDAAISLGLTKPLKTLEGVDRLIQAWMMIFLTTPGSDVFTPNSGGGAKSIIGRNTNAAGVNVAADLQQAIERTKTELLRLQANKPRIPLNERMLSCNLDAVHFDPDNTVLKARVSLQSMAGDIAEVTLR